MPAHVQVTQCIPKVEVGHIILIKSWGVALKLRCPKEWFYFTGMQYNIPELRTHMDRPTSRVSLSPRAVVIGLSSLLSHSSVQGVLR